MHEIERHCPDALREQLWAYPPHAGRRADESATHFSTLSLSATTLQRLVQGLRFTPGKVDDHPETLWMELRYIAGTGGIR